jgi:hypothetical protein
MMSQSARHGIEAFDDFEGVVVAARLLVTARAPIAAPADRNSRRDFMEYLLRKDLYPGLIA